jgi:predicted Zn finger-like uncharacterized protein
VKFLCDRCKTRYSIGDDRVRGKILKIRCKNCANVITVREGMMPDPEAAPIALEQPRVKKPTTGAPEALNELEARGKQPARSERPRDGARAGEPEDRGSGAGAPDLAGASRRSGSDDAGRAQAAARRAVQDARRSEPVSALNAAFASAMAKPPPALEEEWYVSIDGEQEGPFSLAEAQHWVAQKPFDAELHCWSEGFDDWLPVDKVSHFRGLRKRPPPAVAPPPLPRIAGVTPRPGGGTPVPIVDEEPKPLFAATMASLERGAPVVSNPPIALPATAAPARATPARGNAIAQRTNGVRNAAVPAIAPAAALEARSPDAKVARPAGSPSSPVRSKAISDSFDPSDPSDSDAMTQFGPVPHRDPLLLPRRDDPPGRAGRDPAPMVSAAPAQLEGGDDHELAIGEVSRVVNLADIVRDRGNATRRSGINPTFRSTGAIASMAGITADGTPVTPDDGDAGMAMAPVAGSHHRGLITLLSVAGVMVLGVIGAVVLLVTTDDDPLGGKLGHVRDIDTSRPEDPITHRPLGSGATSPTPPNPFVPRVLTRPRVNPNPPVGSSQDPEPPPGNSLSADEVEDVARRHQDITNRCYMRSQRGADSILIGDVKKISVTLTVDGDGNVSDLKLSEHAADNLGKCLTTSIKGWKFRPSAGGTFRFSLNFVGS